MLCIRFAIYSLYLSHRFHYTSIIVVSRFLSGGVCVREQTRSWENAPRRINVCTSINKKGMQTVSPRSHHLDYLSHTLNSGPTIQRSFHLHASRRGGERIARNLGEEFRRCIESLRDLNSNYFTVTRNGERRLIGHYRYPIKLSAGTGLGSTKSGSPAISPLFLSLYLSFLDNDSSRKFVTPCSARSVSKQSERSLALWIVR